MRSEVNLPGTHSLFFLSIRLPFKERRPASIGSLPLNCCNLVYPIIRT
jgi:hypothetical protein